MTQLIALILASEIVDYDVIEACGALLQSNARFSVAMYKRVQAGRITTERGMELSTRAADATDNVDFAWQTFKGARDSDAFVKVLSSESAAFAEPATELSD